MSRKLLIGFKIVNFWYKKPFGTSKLLVQSNFWYEQSSSINLKQHLKHYFFSFNIISTWFYDERRQITCINRKLITTWIKVVINFKSVTEMKNKWKNLVTKNDINGKLLDIIFFYTWNQSVEPTWIRETNQTINLSLFCWIESINQTASVCTQYIQ